MMKSNETKIKDFFEKHNIRKCGKQVKFINIKIRRNYNGTRGSEKKKGIKQAIMT